MANPTGINQYTKGGSAKARKTLATHIKTARTIARGGAVMKKGIGGKMYNSTKGVTVAGARGMANTIAKLNGLRVPFK